MSQSRIRLLVRGTVQGVGLRPFLHRLARRHAVGGWVRNTGEGLEGELEGEKKELEAMLRTLRTSPPPMAGIEALEISYLDDSGSDHPDRSRPSGFRILPSAVTPFATLVSADTALCPDCRRELFSPSDRRYRYPFINCTNCGPRYTILNSLPYDRRRTVMDSFPMCDTCRAEYGDVTDRRYHAQPDCCASCGPEVYFLSARGVRRDGDAFALAQQTLADGGILAVRGIGGIHLACDAGNRAAVARLREIKHRMNKPFALMCSSLDTARTLCRISQQEAELLTGQRRPILLLAKKKDFPFPSASGVSPRAGLMLPYTPLHELLMDGTFGGPDTIVLTSANRTGCPVFTENEEAVQALTGTVDGYLLHNRPIANRCDDSLLTLWEGHPYFFRRSRGYVPAPLDVGTDVTGIFALGAEQKASFALGRGRHVFLSPHIGDLKNAETLEHYQTALRVYCHLFHLTPSVYVCDLHPDYISGEEARTRAQRDNIPVLTVQHHWAHMVSCMADNRIDGPAFGIIWDGTGLAPDHSVWGGEFLTGDASAFRRQGSIRPLRLIGGDRATEEIGRVGAALLQDAGMTESGLAPYPPEKFRRLLALFDSPVSVEASSMGRLFDGVCSLLCRKASVDYEGEGAVLLESLSPREEPDFSPGKDTEALSYPLCYREENGVRIWDTRPVIRGICQDILARQQTGRTVFRFLITLCCMARDQTLALNREKLPVVLSGGVFQNRFLLSGITQLLRQAGFDVYSHRRVSANDEGLCLGQLAIAGAAFPELSSGGKILHKTKISEE